MFMTGRILLPVYVWFALMVMSEMNEVGVNVVSPKGLFYWIAMIGDTTNFIQLIVYFKLSDFKISNSEHVGRSAMIICSLMATHCVNILMKTR